METLPGYDEWINNVPEYDDVILACDLCSYRGENDEEGDACPDCSDGVLYVLESPEPCRCSGNCYC